MIRIARIILSLSLGLVLTVVLFMALSRHTTRAVKAGFADGQLSDTPSAAVRYVAITGSDTSDCTDPDSPCRTPQYATNQALDGDEIRIATGIFTGVTPHPSFLPSLLYITETLVVQGGFSTTDWDHQEPEMNPTFLDAEGQGHVILVRWLSGHDPISPRSKSPCRTTSSTGSASMPVPNSVTQPAISRR